MIGENVEVTVIEIRGDRVKLGFIGPQEVPIHREEVFRRIESRDEAANTVNTR
jgi:carbon storage regulator